MDLGLAGRVVLVTGAGRDLGRATAIALVREGAHVVAAGRDAAALADTCERTASGTGAADVGRPGTSGSCRPLPLDLASAGAAEAAVAAVVAAEGRLDALVSTVGPFPRDPAVAEPATGDDASWARAFDEVFLSAVRVTRAALAPMRAQGRGAVAHVLAASARSTSPPTAQFGAMKAALGHAVRSWAQLGAADGVRVNAILPGWIRTERALARIDAAASASGATTAEAEAGIVGDHPVAFWSTRMGRPEEYADALVFLVSDRAAYVNGVLLPVDGGSPIP